MHSSSSQRASSSSPPGCEVTYELEAVDIIKALLRTPSAPEALRQWYESYREEHGERPTALQTHHAGYNPRAAAKTHGSWADYLDAMGDLTADQKAALDNDAARELLTSLDTTQMTKSYKMLTLLTMLNAWQLPGEMPIEELARGFARLARRSAQLRADVGEALDDADALRKHLEKNPIAAWTGGKGTKGREFFAYDGVVFRTTFEVPTEQREAFQELARELADWRLGEYLDRNRVAGNDEIVCKVSHANGRPILFLPDRKTHPGIPEGPTPVTVDGKPHIARFVKVAVNVLHAEDDPKNNALPEILRAWFGPDAGAPGTNHHASFRMTDGTWNLSPALGA